MLAGDQLGAYCLSEAHAGSDPGAMRTRAVKDGEHYVLNGSKAWTAHGGKPTSTKSWLRTSSTTSRSWPIIKSARKNKGLSIALAALDAGRLGIAAVATGLSPSALYAAVAYANERQTFGRAIIDHQGLGFVLADMAASVESSRATYVAAARLKDAGRPYSHQAAIAKLICTDNAMRVTTDAVQVFGGAGYTRNFPVERDMREAKVMQIFEGTN